MSKFGKFNFDYLNKTEPVPLKTDQINHAFRNFRISSSIDCYKTYVHKQKTNADRVLIKGMRKLSKNTRKIMKYEYERDETYKRALQ